MSVLQTIPDMPEILQDLPRRDIPGNSSQEQQGLYQKSSSK